MLLAAAGKLGLAIHAAILNNVVFGSSCCTANALSWDARGRDFTVNGKHHHPSIDLYLASHLLTDNSPQPKEAQPLSHALTSD